MKTSAPAETLDYDEYYLIDLDDITQLDNVNVKFQGILTEKPIIEFYAEGWPWSISSRLAEKVWPRHGHGPFFERLSKSIFFDCHQALHGREEQTILRKGSKYPFQDDHLFVSHDLASNVRSCFTLDNEIVRSLSDHIPVVAHLFSM